MIHTATPVQPATFLDAGLEATFRRDGYVVVDFASPEVLDDLLDVYHRLDSGIDTGYYPSLMSADARYKAAVDLEIRARLWPRLDALLDGYRPLLGDFMVKHPGPDTEVPPHQDWIVADESLRPTMNAWMPLTPIGPDAGPMRVLPGSNHWLVALRGSPTFPTPWEHIHRRVRDELMVPVHLERGQALVYDIRMLHGTPPNLSAEVRVVASAYGIPLGTTPLHYHRSPDGDVRGYRVSDDFYTRFNIGEVPDGECFARIDGYTVDHLDFDEFARRHAEERGLAAHTG